MHPIKKWILIFFLGFSTPVLAATELHFAVGESYPYEVNPVDIPTDISFEADIPFEAEASTIPTTAPLDEGTKPYDVEITEDSSTTADNSLDVGTIQEEETDVEITTPMDAEPSATPIPLDAGTIPEETVDVEEETALIQEEITSTPETGEVQLVPEMVGTTSEICFTSDNNQPVLTSDRWS